VFSSTADKSQVTKAAVASGDQTMSNVNALPRKSSSDLEMRKIEDLDRMLSNEQGQAMLISSQGDRLPIPESVYGLFKQIVQSLSNRTPVSVIPLKKEMTTQQAADCLNVSRPYLIKLLKQGKIPYRTVGSHRRILTCDLFEYKKEQDRQQNQALSELSSLLQDKGFYDD
jgi:excisionase family DNA binding protein